MLRAASRVLSLALLATLAAFAQTGSAPPQRMAEPPGGAAPAVSLPAVPESNPRVQKLGMQLMCTCGCNEILIQCSHPGSDRCDTHDKMMAELEQRVASGESDSLVRQDFVQEYGPAVLVVPPARGFDLTAWVMPIIVSIVGLGLAIVLVQRWRERAMHPAQAAAKPSERVRADLIDRARAETEEERY